MGRYPDRPIPKAIQPIKFVEGGWRFMSIICLDDMPPNTVACPVLVKRGKVYLNRSIDNPRYSVFILLHIMIFDGIYSHIWVVTDGQSWYRVSKPRKGKAIAVNPSYNMRPDAETALRAEVVRYLDRI